MKFTIFHSISSAEHQELGMHVDTHNQIEANKHIMAMCASYLSNPSKRLATRVCQRHDSQRPTAKHEKEW
jgi:hypothetical protein